MRPPLLMPKLSRSRAEHIAVGIAIFAVGAFLGGWVIGPALSHDVNAPVAKEQPMTYEAMLARPDPFPYRTATPIFDTSSEPNYGAQAREQARAELGGRRTAQSAWSGAWSESLPNQADEAPRAAVRYRIPDRHAVY